ncbi:MAG: phosphatase PAP2 family protein, partial [Alphaproteobacteria bacterium]|nr:phosphatase PAP2 family protein [Alphaproteobacteria bacterium]
MPIGRSVALALALAACAGTPAWAQVNCAGLSTTACAQATDQYQRVVGFQSLPNTATGMAVMRSDLAAVESIYLNATTAQRDQAATNFDLKKFNPQLNVWSMLTSTNQIFPSLQAFPQLQLSTALAAANANLIPAQGNPYAQISTLFDNAYGTMQGDALKSSFTAYATAFAGQATQYAFPAQTDPRPFQISSTIANAPWTEAQASKDSVKVQSKDNWGDPGTGQALQGQASFPSDHSLQGNTAALLYAMMLPQAYQSLMVSAQQFGLSRNIMGAHHPLDVMGSRIVAYYTMTQILAGNPLYNIGSNAQATLQQLAQALATTLSPAATAFPYASCATTVATCLANGTFPTAAQFTAANQAYAQQATYGLFWVPSGSVATSAPANSNLLIASRFPYLSSQQQLDVLSSTMLPAGVPFDDGSGWARLNLFAAAGGYGAFSSAVTVTMDAAQGGFNAIDVWSNNVGGSGSLTKLGSGTLVLAGNNTYTGGTTVGGGTLALSGTLAGNLTILPGASFVSGGGYAVTPTATLANAGTFQSVNAALLNQGSLSNSGSMLSNLSNSGSVSNTGTLTGTVSNSGSFANNGTVTGAFTNSGILSGGGTMAGSVANSGVVAPGNSTGTLSVTDAYTQSAGSTYAAEVNGAGIAVPCRLDEELVVPQTA